MPRGLSMSIVGPSAPWCLPRLGTPPWSAPFIKRLAGMIAHHDGQEYPATLNYIHCRLLCPNSCVHHVPSWIPFGLPPSPQLAPSSGRSGVQSVSIFRLCPVVNTLVAFFSSPFFPYYFKFLLHCCFFQIPLLL